MSPTPTPRSPRCSPSSALASSTSCSQRSPRRFGCGGARPAAGDERAGRRLAARRISPPRTGPADRAGLLRRWRAPTTTRSPPSCGRSPAARSSSPPTRPTSPRSPRASCRRCSSTRRWWPACRACRSPTPPSTTARPPSSRPSNLAVAARAHRVLCSQGVHPHWRQRLRDLRTGRGQRDRDGALAGGVTAWDEVADEGPGAVVVAAPNFLGCLEDIAAARAVGRPRRGPPRRVLRPGLGRAAADRRASSAPTWSSGRASPSARPSASAARISGCSPAVCRTCGASRAHRRGDRGRRGPPRLRDDSAGPRAGHPPGTGVLQRLHEPDPHGRDGGHPPLLARPAGPARGCPPLREGDPLHEGGALADRRSRADDDGPRATRVRRADAARARRRSSSASWRGLPRRVPVRAGFEGTAYDGGLLVAATERRTRAEIDEFAAAFEKAVR